LGRIKTALVKRISKTLMERYSNLFTADFEHNKKIVDELTGSESKKIKDQIAGYITKIKKHGALSG